MIISLCHDSDGVGSSMTDDADDLNHGLIPSFFGDFGDFTTLKSIIEITFDWSVAPIHSVYRCKSYDIVNKILNNVAKVDYYLNNGMDFKSQISMIFPHMISLFDISKRNQWHMRHSLSCDCQVVNNPCHFTMWCNIIILFLYIYTWNILV